MVYATACVYRELYGKITDHKEIRIASIVFCFVLQRTPTNENNSGTEWQGIQQLLQLGLTAEYPATYLHLIE